MIADDLLEWVDKLRCKYSRHTCTEYLRDVKNFISFICKYQEKEYLTLDDLKNISLRDIRAWLCQKQNSQRSNARSLSSLKNFYKHLNKNHNISCNSPFEIKTKAPARKLPKSIQHEEILKITDYLCKEHDWISLRDRAILLLLYGSGLRISEALNLSPNCFEEEDKIRVEGKGNKERIVPVLQYTLNAIKKYHQACPYTLDEFLFIGKKGKKLNRTTFAGNLIKIRKLINSPEKLTAHSMRHSFATALINSGAGIRDIQVLLGHEDISTTDHYTNVNSNYLFTEYRKAHPHE